LAAALARLGHSITGCSARGRRWPSTRRRHRDQRPDTELKATQQIIFRRAEALRWRPMATRPTTAAGTACKPRLARYQAEDDNVGTMPSTAIIRHRPPA